MGSKCPPYLAYSVDNQLATGAKSSALPRSASIPFSELDRFYNTKFSGDMSKAQIESTLLSKGNSTQAIVYGVDSSGRYGMYGMQVSKMER